MHLRRTWIVALTVVLAVGVIVTLLGCGSDTTTTTTVTTAPAETITTAAPETTTSTVAAQEPMDLKWSWIGPGVGSYPELMQWAAAEIGARTNGAISSEVFMGTLGAAPDMMSLTGGGSIDVSFIYGSFTGEQNPYLETMGLPGGVSDTWACAAGGLETFLSDARIRAELEAQNVVPLFSDFWGGIIIVSNKPLQSLEDFKGLRIRTAGGASSALMQNLGAVPVAMGGGEVYDALDKGVLDAAMTGVKGIGMGKWNEVTKYAWLPGYTSSTDGAMVMNKDVWNKLTPDSQGIVLEVMHEFTQRLAQRTMEEDSATVQSMKDNDGIEFAEPSAGDVSAFDAALGQVRQDWFKQYDAGKGLETGGFFDELQSLQLKYEQEVKDKGYPWAQ